MVGQLTDIYLEVETRGLGVQSGPASVAPGSLKWGETPESKVAKRCLPVHLSVPRSWRPWDTVCCEQHKVRGQ